MKPNSINRIVRLVRILFSEHLMAYGVSLGIVTLIQFAFAIASPDPSVPVKFFPVLLCISGCLMAASAYRFWSGFGRSAFYLLLPATAGEKFLAILLSCMIIFLPVFVAVYFLTAYFFQTLFHAGPEAVLLKVGFLTSTKFLLFALDALLIYLLALPVFLYSAARYRGYAFASALLILVIVFIAYNYWQLFLLYVFSDGLSFGHTFLIHYGNIDYYQFQGEHISTRAVDLLPWVRTINSIAWLVVAALVNMAAWMRLREREI